MEIGKFLELLKEELMIEEELSLLTDLKELEVWDSMTAMLLIGTVSNEFNIDLTFKEVDSLSTIESLVNFIGRDKFN